MERITVKSYLRDKAMDRDEDDSNDEVITKHTSTFVRTNKSTAPTKVVVKPRWIIIRKKGS